MTGQVAMLGIIQDVNEMQIRQALGVTKQEERCNSGLPRGWEVYFHG